jgi:dienelactone hydrolase
VITQGFHRWERRLASVDTNRIVRPFEWGLDWLSLENGEDRPGLRVSAWSREATSASDRFFQTAPTGDYERDGEWLRFPSPLTTPHAVNNTVTVRIFPANDRQNGRPRKAVVVLPQWNSSAEGHVGLCRLLARFGVTALRLSLPYHDERRPAELERADYIVSPNVGRTLQANRQAVLDAKRTIDWLVSQGFERIGVLGTSLGSCLAMLTMTHDPRIRAGAFNHVSPFFADVVWHGLSTCHVRNGLEGHLTLDELREYWMPISPWPFIDRARGRHVLLIYARYDLTFPVDLSRRIISEFQRLGVPHNVAILPCGHYTTGKAPFKYLDGYYLTRFLVEKL